MIIDAIKLYSATAGVESAAEFVELSLDHASITQSYILEDATGLDADEIFSAAYGSYTDDVFVNLTPKTRVLSFKIRLNPQRDLGETPSSLRDSLYKLIAATRTALTEVRLMNGGTAVAFIRGQVKKFEAPIFGPDLMVQITIECDYPFFRGFVDVNPVSEEDFTEDNAVIVDDISTAPHGTDIIIQFVANTTGSFVIQGVYGTTEAPFSIDYAFQTGDILHIHTHSYDKLVRRYRGSGSISLIDRLDIGQIWPTIFPGENRFDFSHKTQMNIISMDFVHHFWGV